MSMMEPLTWHQALTAWEFSPVVSVLVAAALAGYLVGVRTARRRGAPWPMARTAAFVAAAVVVVVALQSSMDSYSMVLYWLHMVQHLTLIMIVPALLVLGAPWALLEACGGRAARVSRAVTRGPVGAAMTLPGATLAFYAVVLIGTHLTSFMSTMADHMWLHHVEAIAYLLSGYLFLLPLLGNEARWRVSYPFRVFWLMVGMGVDTLVGVVLMTTTGDALSLTGMHAQAWAPPPLDDLHIGGAVMWVFGDGLMLLFAIVAVNQWIRDTEHRDEVGGWLDRVRRNVLAGTADEGDTRLSAARSVDDDDASLEAYNRMLASLARRDRVAERGQGGESQRAGR